VGRGLLVVWSSVKKKTMFGRSAAKERTAERWRKRAGTRRLFMITVGGRRWAVELGKEIEVG